MKPVKQRSPRAVRQVTESQMVWCYLWWMAQVEFALVPVGLSEGLVVT